MNKQQIAEALKKLALEQLRILETFTTAQRDYAGTVKAYRLLTGEDLPGAPAEGVLVGRGRKLGSKNRPSGRASSNYGQGPIKILSYLAQHGEERPIVLAKKLNITAFSVNSTFRRFLPQGLVTVRHMDNDPRKGAWYSIAAKGKTRLAELIGGAPQTEPEPTAQPVPAKPPVKPMKKASPKTFYTLDALDMLNKADGGLSPREMADAVGFKEGSIGRKRLGVLMPYLRSKGWVTTTKNSHGVTYAITSAGQGKLSTDLHS